jgi:hypothetical protein
MALLSCAKLLWKNVESIVEIISVRYFEFLRNHAAVIASIRRKRQMHTLEDLHVCHISSAISFKIYII